MPIRPSNKGGGGGGTTPTKTTVGLSNVDNTSDLAKPISTATQAALDAMERMKTVRLFDDFLYSTTGDVLKPLTVGALNSATVSGSNSDGSNHVGIFTATSSTTAASGVVASFPISIVPISQNPTLVFCFKTPSTIDPASIIMIGCVGSSYTADRFGLSITGNSATAIVVNGGTTTATSSTYTVAANTWYIAKVEIKSLSQVVVTLFSDTGTSLLSYTANTTLPSPSNYGLRAVNTGTVAVPLCNIDYIDLSYKTSGRVLV